ncbi:MAG: ferric reductase-like transmembrane domain-containing protein [Acidobacteria bacterium]|nr:ferric reductase-like transmembrane domain-containing protein [Acidobacteriota bacterium]
MTLLDLSADLGLIAVGFITANLCIGLLIAMRYSPVRCWPHRRFDVFRLHRWTAYGASIFLVLHPAVLLWLKKPRFRMLDVLIPVWSPNQPLWNTVGAIALYLLAIVVASSILRVRVGRHWWRLLHWLNYPAAAALFLHGVFTDPDLKGARVDYLDGEKVYIELCLLAVLVLSLVRWRYQVRKDRLERARHIGRYAHSEDAVAG